MTETSAPTSMPAHGHTQPSAIMELANAPSAVDVLETTTTGATTRSVYPCQINSDYTNQ